MALSKTGRQNVNKIAYNALDVVLRDVELETNGSEDKDARIATLRAELRAVYTKLTQLTD